jgi:hypothetical protein
LGFQAADAEHDIADHRYRKGPDERKQRPLTEHIFEMEFRYVNPYRDEEEGVQKPLPILFTLTSESAHQLLISLEKGMMLPVSSTADIGFKIMALIKQKPEKS